MCVRMRGLSVLALLFLFATSPASAANSPDGQPRPTGYPETPTRAYGPTPDCLDPTTKTRVDCEWYGFAHKLYPTEGALCLTQTRAVLSNSSFIGFLKPYTYYLLNRFIFDTATNTSYCVYGCFKLAATSPESAPTPSTDPPAPILTPPPPVRLSSPPPPAPITTAPPPDPEVSSPPPPPRGLSTPPPTEPMTPPPPATPRPGVISLNAAGFVRPVSGIVSLVVSGALLALNLLLC